MNSRTIILKTAEEIELMRHSNRLVGMTLGELSKHIKPGVTTLQLDKIAEQLDKMRNNNIISNNKMKQKENININENKFFNVSISILSISSLK